MPLQMMVAIEAVSRGHRYPEQAKDVNFNPCGQVIGRATTVRKAKDVVLLDGRGVPRGDRAPAVDRRRSEPRRCHRLRRPGALVNTFPSHFLSPRSVR